MMYALFKGSKQISKAHSTKEPMRIEAYEAGLVYTSRRGCCLSIRVKIKEV